MPNPENLNTPWKPGQSGNPNGRKKGSLNTKTILKKFLSIDSGSKHPITGEKMNCLEHILVKAMEGAMKGNLKAAKELLDRFEGKAIQSTKIDTTISFDDMSENEKHKKLKELLDGLK